VSGDDGTPRDLPVVRALAVIHQEGVIAVVALVGLWLRDQALLEAFAPRQGAWLWALAGPTTAGAAFLLMLGLRIVPAVRHLEAWQQEMVADWDTSDIVAVAFMSGLAEEALVRALLQPWIGLWPASVAFALLHVVPDRRLWIWPIVALAMGLGFGLLFEAYGYPAAAAAHMVLNFASLLRLKRGSDPD
jgi:hypothetical protein